MSDGFDWNQLREIHLAESTERLAAMEAALLDLEREPADAGPLESLRRDAHTLKGNAGVFGFDSIASVLHAFEDALEGVRKALAAGRSAQGATITLLLETVDGLRSALPSAEAGQALSTSESDLIERLGRALAAEAEPSAPGPASATRPASERISTGEPPTPERPSRTTLRVEASRVDALIELASEITIARGRIESVLAATELPDAARAALEEALPMIGRLTGVALGMRLVPFGPIFATHRRTARDAAQTLSREVWLETAGDEVEIDLALVDRVSEILLHMVRNSVAHGIESPQHREAQGKPRVGTISMTAAAAAGQVVIEVADDGAGLDLAALRERARRLGIEPTGDDLQDSQLVFASGLSTASVLSEVSGRGVGLDSVKAAIERLAGSIEVTSTPGKGTRFRVRLPLTLAIIRGLHVGLGQERYVLPTDMVQECCPAPESLQFGEEGLAWHPAEPQPLPVISLGRLLSSGPAASGRHMVVVRHASMRVGLLVDALAGEGPVVVKSIGKALRGATSVFGAAILGDGYVALILDVPDLISRLPLSLAARTAPTRRAKV